MEYCYYDNGKGLEEKSWSFRPPIFHSLPYVRSRCGQPFCSFTLEEEGIVCGIIHFSFDGRQYYSLERSPFGGLAGSLRTAITTEQLNSLVGLIKEKLGAHPVQLNLPFSGYPSILSEELSGALLQNGFSVQYRDLHQYIETANEEEMLKKMHPSHRRMLSKCVNAGLSVREETTSALPELHDFIAQCRKKKGLQINIPLPELMDSVQSLPGVYQAFTVRAGEEIRAACITATVSPEVLYYYLPASVSLPGLSPMVLLLWELCRFAYFRRYKVLDLGKSSVLGSVQHGLATFKARMGAKDDERLCLCYQPGSEATSR